MGQLEDDERYRELLKDRAFDEGYNAYHDGLKRSDNPYDNNGEWYLNQAWLEGFLEAAWDD